nr:biotin-dependent carboxyltransferase [Chthoniobacterales bacterium]
ELPVGHTAFIRAGGELEANAPPKGARAWLAISGGIDVPVVLGSRATDLRSRFGGFQGRALLDGDELRLHSPSRSASALMKQLEQSHITTWSAPNEWSSPAPRHPFLRIVRGADWSRFRKEAVAALLSESFTVTNASDRMGVRLQGNGVTRDDRDELLSEAVAPGTIQIPGDGQPIVLLGDCQTIGGYPKIAHVITVDLPAAAQLSSGDIVRFAEVTLAEAQQLLLQRARDLAWFRAGLTLKFT